MMQHTESRDVPSIPLKLWISRALDYIETAAHSPLDSPFSSSSDFDSSLLSQEEKINSAILSEAFLTVALKIAFSLANQLCHAEKNHSKSSSNGASLIGNRWIPLPKPGTNWADHIVVSLPLLPKEETSDGISSLFFNGDQISSQIDDPLDPQDLLDVFDDIDPFPVTGQKKENDNVCNSGRPPYLNVIRAEIVQPASEANVIGNLHETERLFSLGVVFYELFSGGTKPPELEPMQYQSPNNMQNGTEANTFNPLPMEQPNSIDLSSALQILEDLRDDDEPSGASNDYQRNGDSTRGPKRNRASNQTDQKTNANSIGFISIEPLRLLRLPNALCDLIANMLDCANGDLKQDDSYSQMSDVLSDLKLMLEKPEKYLHDLDLNTLSMGGLKFSDAAFGREDEYATLLNAYQRSIAGKNEMAIIIGMSGVGKTLLSHQLARTVTADGAIFLSGKFDQQKQAKPFSAITTAFNEYFDFLADKSTQSEQLLTACTLRESFGDDVTHLIKIIPNLGKILNRGNDFYYDKLSQQGCVDAMQRLQYLLCKLLLLMSNLRSSPIILHLDDMQWADPASLSVMNQLMLVQESTSKVFFLGCCRDDEMSNGHPVLSMISNVRSLNVNVTVVNLSCMDKATVNALVSELLCLSPRLTSGLSDVLYHKTKGNPLFLSQLMLSLNKEGILRINLARCRWEWNEDAIQSRALSDDVASFFTSMIGRLPQAVQSAMSVLASFGASTDFSLVKCLEERLNLILLAPLEVAVAEGFLLKTNVDFRFSHDRFQEISYFLIDPSIRQQNHFTYGLALSLGILERGNNSFLFSSVGQLNRGGSNAATDETQRETAAQLNLLAGKQAIEMSDFSTAFYFFENGISFLPKDHWSKHYELSLKLFDAGIKSTLAISDFANLKLLSKELFANARKFEDRLNTLYVATCALAYSSNVPAMVEKGLSVLDQLGENLPKSFSQQDFDSQMHQVHQLLSRVTNNDLLSYRPMTDFSKVMAMKFLARLQMSLLMMRPTVQPFVSLKMLQLSLEHGFSPMAPLAFAYYGNLLAKMGNITDGYNYSKIAIGLLDRVGSKEAAGEVYTVTTMVVFAVEPIQAANENFVRGHNAAMAVGDLNMAMLNSQFHASTEFWTGMKLQMVVEKISDVCRLMKRHENFAWLSQLLPLEKSALVLIGNTDQNHLDHLESMKKNPHHSMLLYFHHMFIHFLFRNYDDSKAYAEKYFQVKMKLMVLSVFHAYHAFYDGLISFWLYRETKDLKWAQRGRQSLSEISVWAGSTKHNFQNKLLLMEAEEQFCNRAFFSAISLYEKSIASARMHKFVHEEALAFELAAHCTLAMGEKEKSAQYFRNAHQKYQEWGALAKATSLSQYAEHAVHPFSLVLNGTVSNNALPSSPYNDPHGDVICLETNKRRSINLT